MKLRRITNLRLALLLALILPLQAFAAVSSCAQVGMAHAAAHSHCDHATPGTLHHDCGNCCCIAASSGAGASWLAPRFERPLPAAVQFKAAPSAAIDRLDRPPR